MSAPICAQVSASSAKPEQFDFDAVSALRYLAIQWAQIRGE